MQFGFCSCNASVAIAKSIAPECRMKLINTRTPAALLLPAVQALQAVCQACVPLLCLSPAFMAQGVDKCYDDSEAEVVAREADLLQYLEQIRRQLRAGKELCYVTVNKDANLLEIPQASTQWQSGAAVTYAVPVLQKPKQMTVYR